MLVRKLIILFSALTISFYSVVTFAEKTLDTQPPVVAIVIDDLGHQLDSGLKAVSLPAKLTFSFLPHSPYASQLAEAAWKNGSEIMLHMPMSAESGKDLGHGGLHKDITEDELKLAVKDALDSIPHVRGINNHMGSHLTKQAQPMQWLMQSLSSDDRMLYFLDSRTTHETVAETVARSSGIDATRRDVFIDHHANAEFINQQLDLLIKLAKKNGYAIGIAHPYPETLAILSERLPQMVDAGYQFAHVSEIIQQQYWEEEHWLVKSSYHSHKAAKNSKQSPSLTCCEERVLK